MANEDEGFNCCGESPTGAQAAECIAQDLEDRIIPCGTRKPAVKKGFTERLLSSGLPGKDS
jgi:hypothetical protein